MSLNTEHPLPQDTFENSDQERLDLIARMDRIHESRNRGLLHEIRSRLVARKVVDVAQRPEVYPLQAFDLGTRLVALNPRLERVAHSVIERKYAQKSDMPKPLEDLTYRVLEKTVEKSAENDDDTATLPKIVIAADSELTEQRISQFPASDLLLRAAEAQENKLKETHPAAAKVIALSMAPKMPDPTAAYVPVQFTHDDETAFLNVA